MRIRTPTAAGPRPPLPAFEPVPRKCARHDGWTPARQRAFIAALADTGSVSRACAMINMTTVGAYYLRRQPGADGFRAAWEAALDFGVARMKDIAFERAIEGYLVPVFAGGKLLGWRRKHNDRLLMFCLRHYGEDAAGKRTTINYFSTRATAGAPSGRQQAGTATLISARDAEPDRPGCASGASDSFDVTDSLRDDPACFAEASTTTVRTVITGGGATDRPDLDQDAQLLEGFDSVPLDEPARAAIHAILADCAARRRAAEGTADDVAEPFFAVEQEPREVLVHDPGYKHPRKALRRPPPAGDVVVDSAAFLEPSPRLLVQPDEQFRSGPQEFPWEMLDQEEEMARIEEAVASVRAARSTESKTNDGAADASALVERCVPSSAGGLAQPSPSDVEAGFTPAEPPSAPSSKPKSKPKRRKTK